MTHFEQPPETPFGWLEQWIAEAKQLVLNEPMAMNLATVSSAGIPSSRIVLFKGFHNEDIRFFTNFSSRKGEQLAANQSAALCFWWDAQMRQVRIEGRCEKQTEEESDGYFASRARGSQLGAWASEQSQPAHDRNTLEQAYSFAEQRFQDQDVPRPPHWGGYLFKIDRIEFWQGRNNRFHDRMLFERRDHGWATNRLQP